MMFLHFVGFSIFLLIFGYCFKVILVENGIQFYGPGPHFFDLFSNFFPTSIPASIFDDFWNHFGSIFYPFSTLSASFLDTFSTLLSCWILEVVSFSRFVFFNSYSESFAAGLLSFRIWFLWFRFMACDCGSDAAAHIF